MEQLWNKNKDWGEWKHISYYGDALINNKPITNYNIGHNGIDRYKEWLINEEGLLSVISGDVSNPSLEYILVKKGKTFYRLFYLYTELELMQVKVKYGVD